MNLPGLSLRRESHGEFLVAHGGKESMQAIGAKVFRMVGVFDVPAAHRLARALAQTGELEQVRIDLTQVREFHDYGVTVLAQALASRGTRIVVRGLRQHHRRLLRYFGIDTGGESIGTEAELV
jgi:anti-anti-sigma regulatory factor